jgi:crossover junction endodeoxyribonuclease RuvC
MIVLGVDPGSLVTGYGIIQTGNRACKVLVCGAIKNHATTAMPERLKLIFQTLTTLITAFEPDELAIETAFYGKNAQSALKLGQARGVSILAAVTNNIPTHEYSPREVKKAVVGNGTASKEQVQAMMKSILKLKKLPRYYDTTDALAVAVCHVQRRVPRGTTSFASWKSYLSVHPEKILSLSRS